LAKRRQKQLSVLVIPDDGSRTLEFKLSYIILAGAGILMVGLLALVAAGGVFLFQAQHWKNTASALRQDNARLRREAARVDELAQMVARMKMWDQQLRTMLSPAVDLPAASYSVPVSGRHESGAQVATVPARGGQTDNLSMRWVPSIWPVPPSTGWVTREFESQRGIFKNQHLGIDIAAPGGSPVQAAADGRVVFADVDDVMGQMVAIDHSGVYMTRYGHNEALLVSEGEEVRRGQHIALVGNTGHSSGPHLHYEVIEHGRAIDPRRHLP